MTSGDYRAALHAAVEQLEKGAATEAYATLVALRATAPDDPFLLHALARAAHALGRFDLAAGYAGKAVTLAPYAAFHVTLGLSLLALGHGEPARAALHVATLQDPSLPSARLALAEALEALGHTAEAEAELHEAIRLRPLEAGYRVVLGRFLQRQGRIDDALRALREGRQLAAPDDVATRQHEATLLGQIGASLEAEPLFRDIRALRPQDPAAHANHGAVLFTLGRLDGALDALQAATALGAPGAETLSNLGLTQMALGRLAEARESLDAAARLRPDDMKIALNQATLLNDLGERDAARALFLRVMTEAPHSPDAERARFNLGTIELAEGNFATGWRHFESRRALLAPLPRPDLPVWTGEPGMERVLLCGEQGLGDLLQFLRYVPLALERRPVHLVLPETLLRLVEQSQILPVWGTHLHTGRLTLSTSADGDQTVARASLLSLPHLLNISTPPAFSPYLAAPALAPRGQEPLRVGLCWAGSATYRFDRRRSLAPNAFAGLLEQAEVVFASLQASDPTPTGMEPLPVGDMATTAQVVAGLDLVITVDTAIAHLAGALGKPVWLLNRFGGDWRWGPGNRVSGNRAQGSDVSLWYPDTRFFDQTHPDLPAEAWQAPLRALDTAFRDWLTLRT